MCVEEMNNVSILQAVIDPLKPTKFGFQILKMSGQSFISRMTAL